MFHTILPLRSPLHCLPYKKFELEVRIRARFKAAMFYNVATDLPIPFRIGSVWWEDSIISDMFNRAGPLHSATNIMFECVHISHA